MFKSIALSFLFICGFYQVSAQEEEDKKLLIYNYALVAAPTSSNLIVIMPERYYSPAGSYFKVWDLSKGLVVKEYVVQGSLVDFHTKGYSRALALFSNGKGRYEVWDTEKGERIKHFLMPYNEENPIEKEAIAPNMKFVAYSDTAIHITKIWDIEQNRPVLSFKRKYSWSNSIEVSPDSRWVVNFLPMLNLEIIDMQTKQQKRFDDKGYERSPDGMFHGRSFSVDGEWFGAIGDEGYMELVNTKTGKRVFDLGKVVSSLLRSSDLGMAVGQSILISPDKQKIFVGDAYNLIAIDVASKKAKMLPDTTITKGVLNITANSKYILSANAGIIRAYDINTGKLYLSFLHTTEGTIVFDAKGAYWTSGNALKQVKKKEIILNLRGKKETVLYPYSNMEFRTYQPQAVALKMQKLGK
jgi:WD40 repeat protein